MPFCGHCINIEFTMIVAAATFICLRSTTKLTVFVGRLSASAPFCVRCNQPIGQRSLFPAHNKRFLILENKSSFFFISVFAIERWKWINVHGDMKCGPRLYGGAMKWLLVLGHAPFVGRPNNLYWYRIHMKEFRKTNFKEKQFFEGLHLQMMDESIQYKCKAVKTLMKRKWKA